MQSILINYFCALLGVFACMPIAATAVTSPPDAVKVFVKGEGGYYCHKIPYLYRTSNGVLIALAEGRGKNGREACDDFSGTDLVFKRSFNNGDSWTDIAVLYSNSSGDDVNVVGNAAPVQDFETGRVWMPICRNNEQVFMTYSDDDGETWAEPQYQPQLVLEDWKWVGLGPPAGLQLSTGRLLVPGYHTTLWKGDGCASKGHTIYSDDHGATWSIGSSSFGEPYLSNECQAVELKNGTILINSRVVSTNRIQVTSSDGGLTFSPAYVAPPPLKETVEGVQGSIVRDYDSNILYFSIPNNDGLIRRNMTVFNSFDEGASWSVLRNVDKGAASYSALQIIPSAENGGSNQVALLYERSNTMQLVFEPDEILFWIVK